MRVRGADEAAGIILLCLLGLAVDETRGLEVRAHALRAGEPGGINASRVHHLDVFVEIVEQRMNGVARRALCVVMQDQSIARILLDQFARREVVLEIDNHFFCLCKYAMTRQLIMWNARPRQEGAGHADACAWRRAWSISV